MKIEDTLASSGKNKDEFGSWRFFGLAVNVLPYFTLLLLLLSFLNYCTVPFLIPILAHLIDGYLEIYHRVEPRENTKNDTTQISRGEWYKKV